MDKKQNKNYSDFTDDIKSDKNLPVYFNQLSEIEFKSSNVIKIAFVKSKLHQTDFHPVNFFYKPICKIVFDE